MTGGAGTVGCLRRVMKPECRYLPYRAEQAEEKSRLHSKLDGLYKDARRRLAAATEEAALLDSAVCVGLLDPVSSIVANNALAASGLADTNASVEGNGEMAGRSLDGLVYFFPYLAGWDAVRYLLVADADLLVAARLIVADRGMTRFSISSPASVAAFKKALRLAAKVFDHPEPQSLVNFWMSPSSQKKQAPKLMKAWDAAASRPPYSKIAAMPYESSRSLQMALLDTFRCFYLRALAKLPRHELRTRYHRSLLMAGNCYGPMDPVSNIILNTIWYDAAFSGGERPVLDMVGPRSLTRLECRSLYGLASFIQTRYHSLSEHEIWQCLVASSGYLFLADPNLGCSEEADAATPGAATRQRYQCIASAPGFYNAIKKLEQQSPCTRIQEAYEAAATAAWHPNPEAQAAFLSSCKAMLPGPASLLLQSGDRLTSEDVRYIASLLAPREPTPEPIKKKNPYHARDRKKRSQYQQRRITAKVKAALDKHLLRDGVPIYELHIICGANESVGDPDYCEDEDDYLPDAPFTFPYSHVNFLVTEKGSSSADRDPILFFW